MVFVKGQSGNPSGRAKGIPDLTGAVVTEIRKNPARMAELVAAAFKHASANPRGLQMMWDRLNGQVPKPIEAQIEVTHHAKRINFLEPVVPEPELPRVVEAEVLDEQ